MNRLAYLTLAASAAMIPATAAAQDRTVDPPNKWEDVPDARLRPPPPGTTWQAPPPPATVGTAPPPVAPRAAPRVRQTAPLPPVPVVPRVETVRVPAPAVPLPPAHHAAPVAHAPMYHAPAQAGAHHGSGYDAKMHRREERVVLHGGERFHVRKPHPYYSRIERGHRVDGYWMGSGHHVRDWNRYGFSEPYGDRRWIRYYDDALLVDRYGTVHDGRYGMDWERYGGGWEYDVRGVPVYVGDDDTYFDDDGYAYAEGSGAYGHDRDYDYDEGYAYGGGYDSGWYGGHHGSGYGHYGYGHYGYGYGGVVTVTETTVTTAPTVVETIYHEDVEVAPSYKVKKRRYKSEPR